MSDHVRTRIDEIAAPYHRGIALDDLAYESGLRLVRVTIREGHRYTMLDLDKPTAARLADALRRWADESDANPPAG
ncbi:MAG: hypothetical protein KGI57_03370 [Hyphomicrobiales bacterium]|nr:hypothetical protein [Hyphomicrobiales bacterium]MDE2016729.1 hypothetical protein [Hyphomicrobiales bacterium]